MSSNSPFQVHREVYQSRLNLPDDPDAAQYRAVSGLAIAGLLAGLLSLLALAAPLLWAVAIVALIVNLKALERIAANAPALLGRKAALAGLAFSVVALCAAPADWIVYRASVRQEARRFAELWFDHLRGDQPHRAHQLTIEPGSRDALGDRLWDAYRDEMARSMLQQFTVKPEVRTLLALGDKAAVRFYATESQWTDGGRDQVYQTYAVTFPDSDGLKTFFIGLLLQRQVDLASGHAYWQITRTAGGVKPKHLGGDGNPPKS